MQSTVFNMLFLNFLYGSEAEKLQGINASTPAKNISRVCHDVYSETHCYELGSKWERGAPGVAKLPVSPRKMKTTFHIASKTDNKMLKLEYNGSFANEPLRKNGKKVIILAHGFLSSRNARWIRAITGELLRAAEENIIVVDWHGGARPPYTQAIANMRLVSHQLASLILNLSNRANYSASSFHLIGHSLGAHLMGLCGGYLRSRHDFVLGRITALDPAGPLFNNSHPDTRLDSSDAVFVDVIHTDDSTIFGFPISVGITSPIGHVDFYPNGGGTQPNCQGGVRCQHHRAGLIFIESIRHSCPFVAVKCQSFERFKEGKCWGCEENGCATLGYNSENGDYVAGSKYYHLTHGYSPFCGSHYRITFETVHGPAGWTGNDGEFSKIQIRLDSKRESTDFINLSESSVYYEANKTYSRVILASQISELVQVAIKFNSVGYFFNPFFWRFGDFGLHVGYILVEQLEPPQRWKYCLVNTRVQFDKILTFGEEHLC